MAIVSRALLKTYFETGDKPTQAQFASLIDSLFHKTEDTVAVRVAVPETSSSTGTLGQYAVDGDYLYLCVATDTWRRVALNDWE
jgi:hypothetical protein